MSWSILEKSEKLSLERRQQASCLHQLGNDCRIGHRKENKKGQGFKMFKLSEDAPTQHIAILAVAGAMILFKCY